MVKSKQVRDLTFVVNKYINKLFVGDYHTVIDENNIKYQFLCDKVLEPFDYAVLQTLNGLFLEYETFGKISLNELVHLLSGNRKLRIDKEKKKSNSIGSDTLKLSLKRLNGTTFRLFDSHKILYENNLICCEIYDDAIMFNKKPALLDLYHISIINMVYQVIDSSIIPVRSDKKSWHDNMESIGVKYFIISNCIIEDISKIKLEDIKRLSGLINKISNIRKKTRYNSKIAIKSIKRELFNFNEIYIKAFLNQLVTYKIIKCFNVDKIEITFHKMNINK